MQYSEGKDEARGGPGGCQEAGYEVSIRLNTLLRASGEKNKNGKCKCAAYMLKLSNIILAYIHCYESLRYFHRNFQVCI